MTARRRPGAPRLIDWTGERCVPWTPDIQVVYEHFHRYLWAGQLTLGKRVLDLASGEGFGAALLAEGAATVTGVDIDETAVRHAQLNYAAENLEFRTADARDLSQFEKSSFDVVVAFELIEHLAEQDTVLAEIRQLLAPGGLLIVSTPERSAYDKGPGTENPFHVRELAYDEFDALLKSRFAHRRMWAQHVVSGSAMRMIDSEGSARGSGARPVDSSDFTIEPEADEWRPTEVFPLLYMVALASDSELPDVPVGSTLVDAQLAIVSTRLRDLADRLNGAIEKRDAELQARDAEVAAGVAELSARDAEVSALAVENRELGRRLENLTSRIVEWRVRYERLASEAFLFRKSTALRILEQETAHARAAAEQAGVEHAVRSELRSTLDLLDWRQRQLQEVEESIIWRATMRVRGKLIALLGGEGGVAVRTVQASLRLLWRLAHNTSVAGGDDQPHETVEQSPETVAMEPADQLLQFDPVDLELADDPVISIVMPLYAGAELTHRALETIRDNTYYTRYEVILVDDGDDPETKALLASVTGARILTNEENLGYLRSVNRGAQTARGRWLVLANNDIEVLPNWAAELLDCGESADDIAIVAPMYLQPDGLISEAGGIIWNDGSGHNYGRGDDPGMWRYTWRRQIDYGSAAALMVRTDVWRELGGFDERFLPMYFEDTDLCFAARDRGYRVMFEPRARVIHKEGSTAGTDEDASHKRHQAANRPRFAKKWAEVLAQDHLAPPERLHQSWGGATARRRGRVLIIDHRVPFWDRESGALRSLELMRALLAEGYHVTFMPDNAAQAEPYTMDLQRMGIEVMFGHDLMTQLSMVLAPFIDSAVVSRPAVAARYMTLLRRHAPQAQLIYDTVDLHWVREAREAALIHGHDSAELITQETLWTQSLELALMRAADVTLVVTDLERARVEADVPGAVVRTLPNVNPVRDAPGISSRQGVIFVGGFEHTPNVEAAQRLINDVMPAVWEKRPDVTVRIVGGGVPPEIDALASPRVEILSWVPDLDPLIDAARVAVAPLSYGAGMKGKVTQALAAGLPVVTTPTGAEGLDAENGTELMIGADDQALAAHVLDLLEDDELWLHLSGAGQALAARTCAPEIVRDLIAELLERPRLAREPALTAEEAA